MSLEEEIVVFNPEGIKPEDYKNAYIEFRYIPEFSTVASKALLFVWCYANVSSPHVFNHPNNKQKRIKSSLEAAFGTDKEHASWYKSFPKEIGIAIVRMQKIRPDARYRAKKMSDKVFEDFEKILKIELKEFKKSDETIDYNAYISTRKNVLKEIENLIDIKEKGFSVSVESTDRKSGQDAIEEFIKEDLERSY